ncbi:Serine/threonine-protein kinase PrkC [Enhygromyxa salina]|uniref:Serine/threonine-protein kinase PrkC n=1 Tax=Enhygromyxa salina TaxID=215803 RepID=A0A2S9YPY5_9BACT|nr:Serine/threonine-protein kinase PrkC [Enhygromyxa salina]
MSSRESPQRGPSQFVDALASAVLRADDHEIVAQAAEAGEDASSAAAALREGFLARVAIARARELQIEGPTTRTHGAARGLDSVDTSETGSDLAASETEDSPLTIGRYPILRRLGAGGMGVVYAAYDEVLDRRLAVKVLHDHEWDHDGRHRERLLREAQAMAKVAHPNVVTVHEVGAAGDRLFIAMEFVSGPTLKEWASAQRRGWRELVPVFCQVADGLAALHEAGLVHRDVKPANVIIGDDGRVRILDLGLVGAEQLDLGTTSESKHGARDRSSTGDSHGSSPSGGGHSSSLDRIAGPLTKTGERVGTPAYMSREQFLGLELTPASDIFSLCVALYEALHHVHPFRAKSRAFQELQANVVNGRIAPPASTSSVPAWLHALVVSGLAPDPKDRPASMRALSVALAKDPSRVRRRWIGTLAIAGLAALGGVLVARGQAPPPLPTCDGAERSLAAVWGPERAERIHAAMRATDRPYAAALGVRITETVNDYAHAWSSAHRRVCHEHRRGDHSDALLDARMACLDRGRLALAETVQILSTADSNIVDHAGQMVAKLPRLDACDDLAAMAARDRPPTDPSVAVVVLHLESNLVRAETLAHAGRIAEATELARSVADEALTLELPASQAKALLTEARASMVLELDRGSSGALLDRALAISIAEDLDPLAAEAMIRRVYVRGLAGGGSEAAIADLAIAEAMLVRAGDDPELRALLLNNAGAVRLAAGDRVGARADFEQALVLKERLFGDAHLEVALGLANLGMLTVDAELQSGIQARMIDIYERRLGPEHPWTLDGRLLAAFHTADPEQAGASLRELCPRFVEVGEARLAGECEFGRARLELARARPELARSAFLAAREQLDQDDDRRLLIDAFLHDDHGASAITALEVLIARVDEQTHAEPSGAEWWLRVEQAERRLVLAELLTDDPARAARLLERSLAELEAIADEAPPIERERLLASTQTALAQVLGVHATRPHARVTELATAARTYYQHWPSAYARRLDMLDMLEARAQ